MAYASASDVANLTPNLLGGGSNFTSSTCPTLTTVNSFLSAGYSFINTMLRAAGYSASAPSAAAVYEELVQINAFYAAGLAEATRTNIRLGPGERTRSQVLMDWATKRMEALTKLDLSAAGLSMYSDVVVAAGGTEDSRKDTVEDDTDLIKPRFVRGQFRYSGANRPRSRGLG